MTYFDIRLRKPLVRKGSRTPDAATSSETTLGRSQGAQNRGGHCDTRPTVVAPIRAPAGSAGGSVWVLGLRVRSGAD